MINSRRIIFPTPEEKDLLLRACAGCSWKRIVIFFECKGIKTARLTCKAVQNGSVLIRPVSGDPDECPRKMHALAKRRNDGQYLATQVALSTHIAFVEKGSRL